MTERRHRPALNQAHIGSPFAPASESAPRKLRPRPARQYKEMFAGVPEGVDA